LYDAWHSAGAYELIAGSAINPQSEPVIIFGGGGPMVEVMQDRTIGLPSLHQHSPVNSLIDSSSFIRSEQMFHPKQTSG